MALPAARRRVEVRTLGSLAICLFVSFDAVWAPPLVLLVIQLLADLREFMFAELGFEVYQGGTRYRMCEVFLFEGVF